MREKKLLFDIKAAIEHVEGFLSGINDFKSYQDDLKTKSAVERQLGIIGEAVNQLRKIKPEISLSHSREIVNFRNRIIHGYDTIDDAIVWTIIQEFLPKLKMEVIKELEN